MFNGIIFNILIFICHCVRELFGCGELMQQTVKTNIFNNQNIADLFLLVFISL